MNRREFLAGLGGTAIAFGLKGPRRALSARPVTVGLGSGGPYGEAAKKYQIDTFERETGLKVQVVMGSSPAHALSIRTNPKEPPFDVFMGGHVDLVKLINEGLMETLPQEKVPNLADVHPLFKVHFQGQGVGNDYGARGISYSTDKISNPPTSWREFVERTAAGEFGKNVFFPNVPMIFGGPETMMLIAKAFTNDELNFAAALDHVKRMKPYIVKFFNTASDPVTLLERGEATIGMGWDGRTWAGHDATGGKMAWVAPRDGASIGMFALGAVKNGQTELALKLINHMLRPEFMSQLAAAIGYGVSNTKAQYTGVMAKRIAKFETLYFPDPNIIIKHSPKWFEMWNREIVG